MLWFMVVIVLATPRGEYVTVAKEVDSRVSCEQFAKEIRGMFPTMYRQMTCMRYKINAERDGEPE